MVLTGFVCAAAGPAAHLLGLAAPIAVLDRRPVQVAGIVVWCVAAVPARAPARLRWVVPGAVAWPGRGASAQRRSGIGHARCGLSSRLVTMWSVLIAVMIGTGPQGLAHRGGGRCRR